MAIEGAVRPGTDTAPSSTGAGLSRLPTRAPGHRRVERAMGTMISLYAPTGGASSEAADEAFAWLHEIDRRFSPFRVDSEVRRLMSSEISTADMSTDLAEILEIAEIVEALSDGAFDIRSHRGDGAPDPTGVVKGWAVDRAGDILSAGGVERFSLGAGGDVLVRGGRAAGVSWRIGVAHPDYGDAVALTLEADDLAVATSGTTQRGRHIVDGRTGAASDELLTLTVAGPSLARADGYATAAFAMGQSGVRWVDSLPGYAAAGITPYGRLITTRGLQQYRV